MYIEPGTNIKLLRSVPLDNTYNHTIYFNSVSDQILYFSGLAKYNLERYSYQRVERGRSRVGIKADSLYDCNYMMFQNASFGTKWFYAFITGVEYINNQCSEITFEIDVMQTWHFNYSMRQCFVEREHVTNDNIGSHIEPETVECGEYMFNDYRPVVQTTDMAVIIAVVDIQSDSPSFGTLYDGIYGSAQLYAYNATDVNAINDFLSSYVQKFDSIISIYMLPKALIPTIPDDHLIRFGGHGANYYITLDGITDDMTLDGYKPKNKKLYTYPYNFYHVDNASGGELALRYEFFRNRIPVVKITGTITQPVEMILRPCNYKGSDNAEVGYTTLNTESIKLNSYPVCSWNVDSYQAWIAQNAIPLGLDMVSNVGKLAVASAFSPVPAASIAMGGVGIIANTLSQFYQASIAADISKGNLNNGGVNTANQTQQFYGGRCSITAEYARVIDDYFNMFGYAVRVCKTPNRASRPHWNYVKTIGAVIKGSVPADDMHQICQIYDKGITFWNNGDEIGNYTLDNSMG